MKRKIEAIARLFGDNVSATIKENFAQLECEVKLTLKRTPDKDTLPVLLPAISDRDTWRLQMLTGGDDDLFDMRAGTNIEEACNENKLQPYYDESVTLIYTITKNKVNDTLSVYDYKLFRDYITGLTVTETLNALQNKLVEKFVMEIWSDEYERFNTCCFAAIKKGDAQPRLELNNNRKKRNVKCDELCQWNNKFTNLTPEDLYILNRESDVFIAGLFDQLCLLLCACHELPSFPFLALRVVRLKERIAIAVLTRIHFIKQFESFGLGYPLTFTRATNVKILVWKVASKKFLPREGKSA